jgi:serine/threonine protein phosphatase PrpC
MRWHVYSFTAPGGLGRGTFKPKEEDHADAWRANNGTVPILAVADGVGQEVRAADASQRAITCARSVTDGLTVPTVLDAGLQERFWKGVFKRIQKEFLERVRKEGRPSQWQTTFAMAALVAPELVVYCSIGDSFLCIRQDDLWRAARSDDRGDDDGQIPEPDPHLCHFVRKTSAGDRSTRTLQDSLEQHGTVVSVYMPGMQGVLLSTDGLEALLDVDPRDATIRRPHPKSLITRVLTADFTNPAHTASVIEERFRRPDFITAMGDDIGVALAARG